MQWSIFYQLLMLQYQIVAVSGDEARKTFYNDKDLNFEQGYCLLRGGVSHILEILEPPHD
jgi:hypothetical protein